MKGGRRLGRQEVAQGEKNQVGIEAEEEGRGAPLTEATLEEEGSIGSVLDERELFGTLVEKVEKVEGCGGKAEVEEEGPECGVRNGVESFVEVNVEV